MHEFDEKQTWNTEVRQEIRFSMFYDAIKQTIFRSNYRIPPFVANWLIMTITLSNS